MKGAVKRMMFGHRLAIEFRELRSVYPSAIRSRSSRRSQLLTLFSTKERSTCEGVNPLRPVAEFFRPRSRSRRTASIISSWSSRKSEMVCRNGSSEMPCRSNSQSAKLIWDFAVLGAFQFSFFGACMKHYPNVYRY